MDEFWKMRNWGQGNLGTGTYKTSMPDLAAMTLHSAARPYMSFPMGSDVGAAQGPDNRDVGGGSNFAITTPQSAAANPLPSWMPEWARGAIGTKDLPGWGNLAVGAGSGLLQGFLGMQQYGLAKQVAEENKRQYNQQYDANRQVVNSQLEDRQRARVASNPGAYESVGDYMTKYGVR